MPPHHASPNAPPSHAIRAAAYRLQAPLLNPIRAALHSYTYRPNPSRDREGALGALATYANKLVQILVAELHLPQLHFDEVVLDAAVLRRGE